ncbi:MAG: hypothetical protein ACKVZJ_05335 [Phycisphaerales bacterium]
MPKRRRSTLSALIALNATLLCVLGAVVLTPPAVGQGGAAGADRARGSYTMVGGRIIGAPEAAIYIVDGVNQELIAARWDRTRKALKGLGYQSLGSRASAPATTNSDPGR